jgi:ankyrin repeat protein
VEVVWLLLQHGFSAGDVDDCGNSCLHLASAGGHHDVVKCLLCAGVELSAVNWYGNSAQALATVPATRMLLQQLTDQRKCAATNVCTSCCVH